MHEAGVLHYGARDCPCMEQVCYTMGPETVYAWSRCVTLGPETVHTWGRCVTLQSHRLSIHGEGLLNEGQRLSVHGAGVLHYRARDYPYMGQVCYNIRPETAHT